MFLKKYYFCFDIAYDIFIVAKGGELWLQKKWNVLLTAVKILKSESRANPETMRKLDICSEKLNTNKSDIVRRGIDKMYDDLKK